MKPGIIRSQQGAVLLVALCLVTVLGISLAGYIALCARTMQLSNRTAQTVLSRQLAEMGLEEALRALNKNDWSNWAANPTNVTSGAWSFDSTYSRATRTINFNAGKLGQGVTGSIKLRIDNYNALQLNAAWAAGASYRVNDLIGDSGIWYRCIKSHTSAAANRPANLNYWVPEGIPWTWDSTNTYSVEDLIVYNEVWYRCKVSNVNKVPASNPTEWQALVAIYTSVPAWPYVSAGQEALLITGGSLVQLTNSTWNPTPPYQWRWRDAQPYKFNDVVMYNGVWYRSGSAHTSSWSNYPTGWASVWTPVTSMWTWSSTQNYAQHDVVYHSATSSWYRCIRAHTASQTPSSTSAYWANTPRLNIAWDSGRQYAANDVVYDHGDWYRSLSGVSNYGRNPVSQPAYWAAASNSAYVWNSTTSYVAGSFCSYGGVWYKAISANSGQSPNNSTYWTSAWAQSSGNTTGAPVIYAEGTVNIAGGGATKTQLRATIGPAPLFPNAVASTTSLTISTGTGLVDSYDSTLGTTYAAQLSTAGNYSAVLAAGTTLSINGTTQVQGFLAWPSPPSGISSGTTVKSLTSPASPNVDTGQVSRSPFIPDFDTIPIGGLASGFTNNNFPKGILISDPAGTGNTLRLGTPGATTPSRYYYNANLNLGTTSYALGTINIVGPVILYINGNLRTRSGVPDGAINITSTGSAEIHVDGSIRTDASTGGFNNLTTNPKKLILISDLTTTTTQYLAATATPLYGVVYAPKTTATLGLEIRTGVEIYGALSANEVTFSSEAKLHYDTSLRYTTISGAEEPYALTRWRELTEAPELATMP